MIGADPGHQADLHQIENIKLWQQGRRYVRRCIRVYHQGKFYRAGFNQAFGGIDRAKNIFRQTALFQKDQQMMFVQSRITQNCFQNLGRLSL